MKGNLEVGDGTGRTRAAHAEHRSCAVAAGRPTKPHCDGTHAKIDSSVSGAARADERTNREDHTMMAETYTLGYSDRALDFVSRRTPESHGAFFIPSMCAPA